MFSFLRRNKNTTDTQPEDQAVDSSHPSEEAPIKVPDSHQDKADSSSTQRIEPQTADKTSVEESSGLSIDPTSDSSSSQDSTPAEYQSDKEAEKAEKPQTPKVGLFTRLKKGLSKTRKSFTDSLSTLLLGRKEIDDDLLDDLEMILLTADVGIDATDRIIRNLTEQVSRKELKDAESLFTALKIQLQAIVEPISQPMQVDQHLKENTGPYVILMVGINGVGKTTTIGKLAKRFQNEGKSVMLAAGDTFRAAAVEQLQTWGERNQVPVIAQKTGADSAAVIFDAIQSAKAKNIDVLIADTAGRLHTQSNLMEELKKVKRVIAKVDETAPHEVMLVIDAGTGQNALNQAQQFQQAVEVSGITVTKLDGTAKGGIVFALAEQLAIPVRFIGVGESIDDLRPFDAKQFTEALFDQNQS
ncbi:MAG: signal recognition particle-docking protein FtsY [Thiomicrorhabdus chilensis]|uniref:signal recognition particle-docking protein FtsY n=1 Tax=Thiomicrorhabdus chilensis TaxID=63656 RepID=UPI00299EC957|nr:signal recognition particle-docking protein FtsY [Thiomicrorhabdus chilensis]MDX1347794.1 signal recognition particle-docking protein FtsY [Thiomicrorhabdus chilensis]